MKRLALFLISAALYAQSPSLSLTASPQTVAPGKSTTLTLSFLAGTSPVSEIQWTSPVVGGATYSGWFGGAALTTPQKQIACANNSGPFICLIDGFNTNALISGTIATAVLSIPTGTPKGALVLTLSGIVAADGNGSQTTVLTTLATVTLNIAGSRFDLNGDGVVDGKDLTDPGGYNDQVTGKVACTTADVGSFNGGPPDGKCDVADIDTMLVAVRLGLT